MATMQSYISTTYDSQDVSEVAHQQQNAALLSVCVVVGVKVNMNK